MADTVIIPLVDNRWTQIALTSGFATNESNKKVVYREATALPAPSVVTGHTLEDTPGAFFQFNLTGTQRLYARSVGGDADLAVTPES